MSATEQTENVRNFDLSRLPADFLDDPFPLYRALREQAPVKRMPDGSYFLTRYEDLIAVYKDTRTFSSDKKLEFKPKYGDSLLYEHHTTSLVFSDPPLHTRVRKLIAGALTPRAIASMEDGLVRLVDALLDRMEDKQRAAGEVDLIEDFASAIPIEVIGNLLGVPADERDPLRDWSLAILGALEPVLSADAFEAFKEAGDIWDPATAGRLREFVFSAGNRRDPAEAYRLFRGRDADVSALMRDRGFAE